MKKLGITDFRHLTKDKVIQMSSMLDRMDPEVAKKAIEQFPNFAITMKELMADYKDSIGELAKSDECSVLSVYKSADAIMQALMIELEKENLTFDEKKFIIEQIMELQRIKGEKDTENKRFLGGLALCALSAIGMITAGLASSLGAKTEVQLDDKDDVNV